MAAMSGNALTENLDPLFELAADVLLNPSFPADEWDRLKTRTRAGLVQQRTQPQFLAAGAVHEVVFGDHPGSRVSATPESLDAITRDAMVEFHRTRFVPDHALIAFAGDISLAEARTLVESKLGAWKKAGVAKPPVTEPAAAGRPRVYLVARPGFGADDARVGAQSMTRTDPEYDAVDGRQPGARRHDGTAVPAPARGEGLYLRCRQLLQRARASRPVVGVARACAPRSPRLR